MLRRPIAADTKPCLWSVDTVASTHHAREGGIASILVPTARAPTVGTSPRAGAGMRAPTPDGAFAYGQRSLARRKTATRRTREGLAAIGAKGGNTRTSPSRTTTKGAFAKHTTAGVADWIRRRRRRRRWRIWGRWWRWWRWWRRPNSGGIGDCPLRLHVAEVRPPFEVHVASLAPAGTPAVADDPIV